MEDEDLQNEGALSALTESLTELTNPSTTVEAQTYARKFLNKQLNSPITGQQGKLLTEMEKNAEESRQTLRAAREKLMARRFNPADKWYALSAALGAPTRVGGAGELAARSAAALQKNAEARRLFEEKQVAEALGYDKEVQAINERLLKLRMELLTGQGKVDADLAKESLKTLGKRTQGGANALDKAQQAVDREYAKDYVDWIQGGAPEAAKSLGELGQATARLKGYTVDAEGKRVPLPPEDDFLTRKLGPTGAIPGSIATVPFAGKAIQDVMMPGGADIREIVEATVQGSLRPILGAQFTEKEGERLIARVYNPRLKPEVNAARVERLMTQLQDAMNNRNRAAKYFEEHGTLKGFKGKFLYTIHDFMPKDDNELLPRKEGEVGALGTDDEEVNPDDELPAIEPGQPPQAASPPQATQRTSADGRPIVKLKDLPKRRIKKKNILGFAKGGAVDSDTILVEMEVGTLQEAPADITQEDILGGEAGEYDETMSRAALAALGAGAGYTQARMGHAGLTGLKDSLTRYGKETPAESRMLQLMEQTNTKPNELLDDVNWARILSGSPMMMSDSLPEFTSLAHQALPLGGTESHDMIQRLRERQATARDRVSGKINSELKPDDYFDKEEQLKTRVYGDKKKGIPSESSPYYDAAHQQFPAVNSKQLGKLLDTPSGSKAVKAAMKTMKDKGIPIGKTNPVTGAVTKYSLEFLNQVKIEMDNLVGMAKNKGASGRVRDLTNLRDAFRAELDTATTDPKTGASPYKEARGIYEEGKKHLDVLQQGREEFGKMQPQEVARAVAGMNFEQKDAFRTGVAQKLYEMLESPSTDINAAKKIVGSPQMRAKLAPLFEKPSELKVFIAALEREASMFENSKKLLTRSESVHQGTAEPPEGPVAKGARKAPALGVFSPTYWALKYLRDKPDMSEKEAAEIIKMLKSQSLPELSEVSQKLVPKVGRKARRKKRGSRLGMAGAAVGALTGAILGGDDEEEILEQAAAPETVRARNPVEEAKAQFLSENAGSLDDEEDPTLVGLTPEEIEWAKRPAMAEGGKVGMLKELIESLKAQYANRTLDPEWQEDNVRNLAVKAGVSPAEVRRQMSPPVEERRAVVRPEASPERLAPYRGSLDFERQRLKRISEELRNRTMADPYLRESPLKPQQAEPLAQGQLATNLSLDRMLSDPSPTNMMRLREMVRSFEQQAKSKHRGGPIRRHTGGMTRHG